MAAKDFKSVPNNRFSTQSFFEISDLDLLHESLFPCVHTDQSYD